MNTPTLSARLARFGFKHGFTGGSCTAYILVLPDGSEVFITEKDDLNAPSDEDDEVLVGAYPFEPEWGHPVEVPVMCWEGRLGDFLAKLEAAA